MDRDHSLSEIQQATKEFMRLAVEDVMQSLEIAQASLTVRTIATEPNDPMWEAIVEAKEDPTLRGYARSWTQAAAIRQAWDDFRLATGSATGDRE